MICFLAWRYRPVRERGISQGELRGECARQCVRSALGCARDGDCRALGRRAGRRGSPRNSSSEGRRRRAQKPAVPWRVQISRGLRAVGPCAPPLANPACEEGVSGNRGDHEHRELSFLLGVEVRGHEGITTTRPSASPASIFSCDPCARLRNGGHNKPRAPSPALRLWTVPKPQRPSRVACPHDPKAGRRRGARVCHCARARRLFAQRTD